MPIFEIPALRGRTLVYRNRDAAGAALADLLAPYREADAVLFAIPAGGVPVAAPVARRLGVPLDVAVTSKILIPGRTEAGFGAIAWDGTAHLDVLRIERLEVSPDEVARGIEETRARVARRVEALRGGRPFPAVAGRVAILVDDGIASGFTMRAAVDALRAAGAAEVVAAAPTGNAPALPRVDVAAGRLFCPNVRAGRRFAVADAYVTWRNVSEAEAARVLADFAALG